MDVLCAARIARDAEPVANPEAVSELLHSDMESDHSERESESDGLDLEDTIYDQTDRTIEGDDAMDVDLELSQALDLDDIHDSDKVDGSRYRSFAETDQVQPRSQKADGLETASSDANEFFPSSSPAPSPMHSDDFPF